MLETGTVAGWDRCFPLCILDAQPLHQPCRSKAKGCFFWPVVFQADSRFHQSDICPFPSETGLGSVELALSFTLRQMYHQMIQIAL